MADHTNQQLFHLIGIKPDGEAVIIESRPASDAPFRRAAILARECESFIRIDVEPHGSQRPFASYPCGSAAEKEVPTMPTDSAVKPDQGESTARKLRTARFDQLRQLISQLGPFATLTEANLQATKEGLPEIKNSFFYRTKKEIWPEDPAANSDHELPAAAVTPVAVAETPSATPVTTQACELVVDVLAIARRCGGLSRLRTLITELEYAGQER